MKISLAQITAMFDDLCSGKKTREEVASFATDAMMADDKNELQLEEETRKKIWKSIIYLSGVDLEHAPGSYLHSRDDVIEARNALQV